MSILVKNIHIGFNLLQLINYLGPFLLVHQELLCFPGNRIHQHKMEIIDTNVLSQFKHGFQFMTIEVHEDIVDTNLRQSFIFCTTQFSQIRHYPLKCRRPLIGMGFYISL